MAESELKRTFRVKNFTGEDEDEWRVWSSKMLAFAQKKGYYDALTDDELDLTVEANSKANLEAISDLTIACDGEAWEIMHDVDSEDVTACEMWHALEEAFHPEEIEDYVDLTNQFKKCEMDNEYENPKIWIRKLQAINRRLGGIDERHKHDDVQMIAEIFLKLPKSYSEFVTSCNLRGVGTGTTQEMIKDLNRFYKRTIKISGKDNNRNGNGVGKLAFVTIGSSGKGATTPNNKFVNYTKAFKGLCNKCGKQGHKGVDCRVRPENYATKQSSASNGFKTKFSQTSGGYAHNKSFGNKNNKTNMASNNVTCYSCGGNGHYARDCTAPRNTNMFVGMCAYEDALAERQDDAATNVSEFLNSEQDLYDDLDNFNFSDMPALIPRDHQGDVTNSMYNAPSSDSDEGSDIDMYIDLSGYDSSESVGFAIMDVVDTSSTFNGTNWPSQEQEMAYVIESSIRDAIRDAASIERTLQQSESWHLQRNHNETENPGQTQSCNVIESFDENSLDVWTSSNQDQAIDMEEQEEQAPAHWISLRMNADWPIDHVFWQTLIREEMIETPSCLYSYDTDADSVSDTDEEEDDTSIEEVN
jgi:hypothetical protein